MHYMWTHLRRKPFAAAAVFLFSGMIAVALCSLHSGIISAQKYYNEIYRQIRVRCTITNLTGDQSDSLNISPEIRTLFTGDFAYGSAELMDLVEDVRTKASIIFGWDGDEYILTAINSLQADPKLWPENGCTVFWNEGFGESIFSERGLKCIIPGELQKKLRKQKLSEDYFSVYLEAEYDWETDYEGEFEVAGVYQGGDEKTIYCAWETFLEIMGNTGRPVLADSLSATLKNNEDLQLFRQRAAEWFAEPDVNAAGMSENNGYFFALDINDSQLKQAKQNLENGIAVNRIAAAAIFILSAGAGALAGFLIIRTRRHEIALMRTLGTTNMGIYTSFVMEQALCVIPGTAAGGAWFLWRPLYQLCLFAGVYFAGLSVTLWVFFRKNLLTIIKEDE